MDLGGGILAGGGLGAIVAAAIAHLVKTVGTLVAKVTSMAERAEDLAGKLEAIATRSGRALEDLAEAAVHTKAMCVDARAHFDRMADAADVVEQALGACALADDDAPRGARARPTQRPGQTRKGERL